MMSVMIHWHAEACHAERSYCFPYSIMGGVCWREKVFSRLMGPCRRCVTPSTVVIGMNLNISAITDESFLPVEVDAISTRRRLISSISMIPRTMGNL